MSWVDFRKSGWFDCNLFAPPNTAAQRTYTYGTTMIWVHKWIYMALMQPPS